MGRKLKVVVNAIPATNPVTGIGRYVLELYAAMAQVGGAEVEIAYFDGAGVSRDPPRPPASLKGFSLLGRVYWSLPLALSLPVRLALHRRREAIFSRASAGADIYHETAFFPFRAAPGVRTVQTIQDLSVQFHPEWHPRERVAYTMRHFRERLAWDSEVLCISEFTRRELGRFDPAVGTRASVTHLAADARFRPADAREIERVRARYALPPRYLFFVGSGDPRKNARALAEVVARGKLGCDIVCAGWEGWLAAPSAHVRMLGYVPDADLPALYSAATAFVFPSLYEGFGLPVVEAMACGCAVVVPRAHSMPELVGDAGAYYGAPDDIDGLERTLVEIAGDAARREALAAAGIERARRFDWRDTARRTLDAFERAAAAPIPAPGAAPAGASRL
jgi:glycosyltransferase involved in cell wall biosynthesis